MTGSKPPFPPDDGADKPGGGPVLRGRDQALLGFDQALLVLVVVVSAAAAVRGVGAGAGLSLLFDLLMET